MSARFQMQVIQTRRPQEIAELMRQIKVDPYGIKIMLPKATACLLRINSVSNITANILKQEMLSLGGDVAVARGALTGRTKKTDCLLIGNPAQFIRLDEKLKRQPFGLSEIAKQIRLALANYRGKASLLKAGRFRLNLGLRPHVMGILNLTPDSFSGDGFYRSSFVLHPSSIVDSVQGMIEEGADIIDIGGESTRPGAKRISVKEEIARTIPVIKKLAKRAKVPISIDTYKPEVAKQALESGASIINDISGLRNPRMAKITASHKAALVIMHMKGTPGTMQRNPVYADLIGEITNFLGRAVRRAEAAGVNSDSIMIDPGIGFGKTFEHNLEIIRRLREFKVLGKPVLIGVSRKSFLGRIINSEPGGRINATLAASLLAVENGADIVRVHDLRQVKEALKVQAAIAKR